MNQLLQTLLFSLLASFTLSGPNIYVDHNATGSDNGSDWNSSYVDLQDAMMTAMPGDTIFVAQGTYFLTSTTDRTISFLM